MDAKILFVTLIIEAFMAMAEFYRQQAVKEECA